MTKMVEAPDLESEEQRLKALRNNAWLQEWASALVHCVRRHASTVSGGAVAHRFARDWF